MKAATLMVQGTTSDAGKSLLVTALCRWLLRQGVSVAPFKPQNMALNSAVTSDGGEIGRAQAVQAAACRIAPHTDMNPVLLKPNSDTGAQVIVQGRAIGNMRALEYHEYKSVAMQAVLQSHQRLVEKFDVVVVEGAGSPAEINLRTNDIANMGFAEAVDCPVILIADIDRGGVFAHLVGTLELLSESERARVAGFVINRFRGDLALLQPGLNWLEQRTGKPVLGVLPYLRGLHLDAEDSLPISSPKTIQVNSGSSSKVKQGGDERATKTVQVARPGVSEDANDVSLMKWERNRLRVVVPVTPRISNHTDFDALRAHPQVAFHFVSAGEAIPAADLIILPGSKSVRADLEFLRAQGWERHIAQHLRYGGKLIGICGGFQMLGEQLHDPLGIEGDAGSNAGLGWLQMETTLAAEKQLRNCRGYLFDGATVSGYEIHAGVSSGDALVRPAMRLEHGDDGAINADNQILGTYLHGVFDTPAACAALLGWAGLGEAQALDYHALREATLEKLADRVEQHLNTDHLRHLLELNRTSVRPELVEGTNGVEGLRANDFVIERDISCAP